MMGYMAHVYFYCDQIYHIYVDLLILLSSNSGIKELFRSIFIL
jgi:hypothetical protein